MNAALDRIPLTQPGRRLDVWRHETGRPVCQLAAQLGLGVQMLARIEAGEIMPDVELAERIGRITDGAVLFHVDVSRDQELRGDASHSPPSNEAASAERGGAGDIGRMAPAPPIVFSDPFAEPHMAEMREVMRRSARARGPGRPGFALARHGDGTTGLVLVLVQDRSVTPLTRADAAGLRMDLDLIEGLLDNPLLFGAD